MRPADAARGLIVGVGASAGGLAAFKSLLPHLSRDAGHVYLLVQHLDPDHRSVLAELLVPHCSLPVEAARDGRRLEPNQVLVIPPGVSPAVREGALRLTPVARDAGLRLPVDALFRSLAEEYGPRSAAIVLSGAGYDGNAGLRAVRRSGGLCLAQDPSTCAHPSMPESALEAGLVDLVLELGAVPGALERFASLPLSVRLETRFAAPIPLDDSSAEAPAAARPEATGSAGAASSVSLGEEDYARLTAVLAQRAGFDPQVYKRATIERRALRRAALCEGGEFGPYLDRLSEDRAELSALVRDILIGVTEFFRDPEAFAALEEHALAALVAQAQPGSTLRVWVPACSTGEEVYSLGIGLLEAIRRAAARRLGVQIFATDANAEALEVARAGVYPASIAGRVPEGRLSAYFHPREPRGYEVRSCLRDLISFATHDLTRDPPFSRMDLVSCRNVLIYLRAPAQERVLRTLHFALRPERYLFLGSSETTGPQRGLFATVSKSARIYRSVGSSPALPPSRPRRRSLEALQPRPLPSGRALEPRRASSTPSALLEILRARVAPTLAVAGDGRLLYSHGDLRPYLRFPEGPSPSLVLSELLPRELATRVRSALFRCRRNQETTSVDLPRGEQGLRLLVSPAPSLGDDAVIVTFYELAEPSPGAPSPADDVGELDLLQRELEATRQDLRSTVEELETSNEELRLANEEASSVNEELQSANEELESKTEELRALNEELTTVNTQLREKLGELERAHDDQHNFFASTKIATIFLGPDLRVQRATPAAEQLLELDASDIGRSVKDMARELLQNELVDEARRVLDELTPISRELLLPDGRWLVREVLPYTTETRRIEGVVVTFQDVSEHKLAGERIRLREQQQAAVARLGLQALAQTDLEDFFARATREVAQTLDVEFSKILELQPERDQFLLRAGVGWEPGLVGEARVGCGPDSQAGYTLQSGAPVLVDDLREERRFRGPALLVEHGVRSGISCVIQDASSIYGVIGAHSSSTRVFTPMDTDYLQAVAAVLASAVTRHLSQVRQALETRVARVLANCTTFSAAMPQLASCFASELGPVLVEEWGLNEAGSLTHRRIGSYDVELDEEAFRGRRPSRGLAEAVFQELRAQWRTDLVVKGEPELEPFRSGLAFPVSHGEQLEVVVTLLCTQRLACNASFLRGLEALGRLLGAFGARLEAEAQARRLAAITSASHDAISSHDLEGRVLEWLDGARELYGYEPHEMVGESIERIVPAERVSELRDIDRRVARGEVVEPVETQRIHKSGRILDVSVRSSATYQPDGEVSISTTDRDMTERKDIERRLVLAHRQKDQFLAMLSHELRNPLAAIQSASEVLGLHPQEPRLRQAQEVLARQLEHVNRLLDGLLDLSRVVHGKIELERRPLELSQVCREVVDDLAQRAPAQAQRVELALPEQPVLLEGDRTRLAQVVDNLLSNALNNSEGQVLLDLRSGDEWLTLEVRDEGVGLEPEQLSQVFEAFQQLPPSLARPAAGLGLGLALVKSLVELHGGTVEAESAGPGAGALFRVRLPLRAELPPPASSEPPDLKPASEERSASSLSLLLIEDNADTADMLRALLESHGHDVELASRGESGLALALSLRPHAVLCDIGLPEGLDGYQVARRLREAPETRDSALIAVSGFGRPSDVRRCLEAGFDAHLTKPVKISKLRTLLGALCAPDADDDPSEEEPS